MQINSKINIIARNGALLCSAIFCVYLSGVGIRQYFDKQDYVMMIVSILVTIFFLIMARLILKETFAIMFRKNEVEVNNE